MTTNPTEARPTFSIITITLNHLAGVKKTHQSLILQTLQDYEWIIVDGASNDGTLDYLNTINDANITSEPDSGLYDAMNKGMKRANGQYLIFLNSGDYLAEPKTLEIIQKTILKDQPHFIYGDALECFGDKKFYKTARDHSKIKQGMITHHQAMIYHHDLLENLQYNEAYSVAADYDLTLKAMRQTQNIAYIHQPLCVFESGGLSQQKVRQGRIEQYKIRRENGVSFFENIFTFTAQTIIYQLRRFAPKLYWFLKRA